MLERGEGPPQTRPCPTPELIALLAGRVAPAVEPRAAVLQALASTLESARGHRLSVGEPSATADALRLLAC
jgi:hypothetical protein